jgi:hypothetical protein
MDSLRGVVLRSTIVFHIACVNVSLQEAELWFCFGG